MNIYDLQFAFTEGIRDYMKIQTLTSVETQVESDGADSQIKMIHVNG
jgi:hypothetical protein